MFSSLRSAVSHSPGVVLSAAAAAATAIATTWSLSEAVADGAFQTGLTSSSSSPQARSITATTTTTPGCLPTDKLSCKMRSRPPRSPLVLVSCGSFNPPTVMHLRMVDLAAEELARRGYDVWGAYLSPVADSYGKKGLAPAADRVAMCRLAAAAAAATTPATGVTAPPAAADGSGPLPSPPSVPPPSSSSPQAASPAHPPTSSLLPTPAGNTAVVGGSMSVATSPSPVPASLITVGTSRRRIPDPDLVMVYDWESRQPGYTRTLVVLRRVEAELRSWLLGGTSGTTAASSAAAVLGATDKSSATAAAPVPPAVSGGAGSKPVLSVPVLRPEAEGSAVRAMLLCGGDVLASMAVPGVWENPDVILREHGVVCVAREGTELEGLLGCPGNVLYDNRDRIILVYDRVGNSISSSKVRAELAAGRPVRYLVPPGVAAYIYDRALYDTGAQGA